MNNEIVKHEQYGISESVAKDASDSFLPKIIERQGYAKVYAQIIASEITPELCVQAKKLRNKLVKVRTGIAEVHKSEKAVSLAKGKYIDALKNNYTLPVTQMEATLAEIENHFVEIEIKRVKELHNKRVLQLSRYFEDAHRIELGIMKDDVYDAYFDSKKKAHEDAIALKIREDEARENERIAADEARKEALITEEKAKELREKEAEKIRLRLKAEADELLRKNKAIAAELRESERKRLISEEAKELAQQTVEQIKSDTEDIHNENDNLVKQLKSTEKSLKQAVKETEKIGLKEIQEAVKAKASTDAEKMNVWMNELDALKRDYNSFDSEEYNKISGAINTLIERTINYVKEKLEVR